MTAPARSSTSPSVGALLGSRAGRLALAVLVVELLAGMQVYLNQTVLPLLATEMGERGSYGLVTAAAQVPAFLTMPLGGAMLTRWRPARLMTALTALLVVGAVVGALAPNIEAYVLGEILRGLAAGALATATMGVMVAGLPDAWRRLCLAAGSGMWVLAALVGPVYASGISASWGWRWALVVYLPLLIAARAVMAGQVRDLSLDEDEGAGGDEPVPWLPAVAMATGVALIGALRASGPWFWPGVSGGTALVLWSCSRVLPKGTLRLAAGRRAGIATLLWVCAFFLTLDYLVAPSAHDVLGMSPTQTGWALTAGGIGWSATAIACGAHPAREPQNYRRRTALAAVFFGLGAAVMVATVLDRPEWWGWWGLPVGYGVASIGMGLTHLDTMNRIVTDPTEPDGITHAQAATAVTIAGAAGGAVLGTAATAFVAPTTAGVETARLWPSLVLLAGGLLLTPLLARRAA
ncbi:MFS transporter [Actinomyces viscosus]|uniref:Arabinose efflux permease n=1 Tax=Actinomyces viscosus TaxID=1656 RepID=A0A448PHW8_ACTVI|nr:MFS transporter [Actinomyces viscosus]TFH53524.1 MFS transporter [Actinomyces viscosus]VEI14518.1 Arabinose efflux permease [Actinomyces viscosus]